MSDPKNPYLPLLLELHPDYQSFTASDFKKLQDFELRSIVASFAHKLQPQDLIPATFIREYGEDAAGEMMMAVERELVRRGRAELFATATLNGGIGNAGKKINPNLKTVNSDVFASVTLADNTVRRSTAPRILNYQVAQDALTLMAKNEAARKDGTYVPQTSFEVTVPQAAVAAVVAANKDIPQQLATRDFNFLVGDEFAFMSGYATRAGASREVGPINMQYPPSAICPAQKITNQIFNAHKPDIDAALAWAAGYIQSDVDQMPAPQRSAALAPCPAKTSASR